MSWRDLDHPEAGGAEVFAERTSAALAAAGHDVTFFSSRAKNMQRHTSRDGFTIVRAGGRYGVYPLGMGYLWRHRHDFDVVVDVQNGVPFWSPLVFRGPVITLIHHVHKEQWFAFFPRPVAQFGWWLESTAAPRVYRGTNYVTVSEASRAEIERLDVAPASMHVVYSGNSAPAEVLSIEAVRSPGPHIVTLGRLVPHKRVELAIDAVAALRDKIDGVSLTVIGGGDWAGPLRKHAAEVGADDLVTFTGVIDEEHKHQILHRSAVMAMPSLKEGWGLTITEAGYHGVPAVAFRSAGGTQESILDGRTGVLVDTPGEFVSALERLLTDEGERARLGAEAQIFARSLTWDRAGDDFRSVVESVCRS